MLGGLWEIMQSAAPSPRIGSDPDDDDGPTPPQTPLQESFSLQAFSSRVQHLFDKVQTSKEQQEILKRQIQQQRELNGNSDAEKDKKFAELQERHHQLTTERNGAHDELARVMVQHQQSESKANQSRLELMNVMNEGEELKKTMETKQQERDGLAETLRTHQEQSADLADNLRSHQEHSAGLQAHIEKLQSQASESENLESEVVRLTTELTMAKADLDSAYGSRAQRAGAQAAEVEALNSRREELEK